MLLFLHLDKRRLSRHSAYSVMSGFTWSAGTMRLRQTSRRDCRNRCERGMELTRLGMNSAGEYVLRFQDGGGTRVADTVG